MNADVHLRAFARLSRCISLLAVFATPAYANQPPGPQVLMAEMLILPAMILLTALGGGYTFLQRDPKRRSWVKALLAVLAVLFSGAHEGLGLIVAVIFGAIGVKRGFEMISLGIRAHRPLAGLIHSGAARARLVSAGAVLIVVAALLSGLAFAFVGWWPGEYYVEEDLRRILTYQLSQYEETRARTGKGSFLAPSESNPVSNPFPGGPYLGRLRLGRERGNEWGSRHWDSEFKLMRDGKGFEVYAWPQSMPIFPYNYLVTLPSFYADHTGQIRMIRVHHAGQRCPPDAPVFAHVQAGDWRND